MTYYCGETTRCAFERLKDSNHHIKEISNRVSSIYIGRISNVKRPTDNKVRLVEKVLTAYLDSFIGRDSMLNETNFAFPKSNIYKGGHSNATIGCSPSFITGGFY